MIRQSFSIHELSIRLGERVAAKSENQQQENMLIYGAEVLLGGMIKIFLLIALSSFMGIRNETLVIVLAAGAFRLLTGCSFFGLLPLPDLQSHYISGAGLSAQCKFAVFF